jgi:hypothetical protein
MYYRNSAPNAFSSLSVSDCKVRNEYVEANSFSHLSLQNDGSEVEHIPPL